MPFDRERYPLPIPEDHYYDQDDADHAVEVIENFKQYKGEWRGEDLELMRWQKDRIIRPLFGLKRPDGTRQYRECFIFVPRKNGKSALSAAISLYLLMYDGESGAEIYGCASNRDQASKVLFNPAWKMLKQDPYLYDMVNILKREKRIEYQDEDSYYEAISRDSASSEGYDAHGVIADEIHRHKSRDLWDTLTTSQGSRREPLTVAITTAGEQREGTLCGELLDYSERVLSGDVYDPSHFAFVCSAEHILEEHDDLEWTDRQVWYYANPALERPGLDEDDVESGFRKLSEFERAIEKAQEMPTARPGILRRYLNIWRSSSEGFVEEQEWREQERNYNEVELYGRSAYGAFDLSSTTDLSAWVLVVPTGEELAVLPRLWVPSETLLRRSREDNVPYDVWHEENALRTTPGDVIDQRAIEEQIMEDHEEFDIQAVGFDPWQATRIVQDLMEHGVNLVEIRQGMRSMSPPTNELIRLIKSDRIIHNGNPVLSWMMGNVKMREDQNENVMPSKKNSTDRIDGVVAMIMAIDQWVRENEQQQESVYAKRGLVNI